MTKVRLLCFSVAVLVIAAISVPAFGTTEEVALSCEGGNCTDILGTAGAVGGTGSGGANFQVLSTFSSTGLSTEVLPELDWLSATFQTAGATFVSSFVPGSAGGGAGGKGIEAGYGYGGLLTVTEGDGSTFLTATFTGGQSSDIYDIPNQTDPFGIQSFDGQFNVNYLDSAFLGGVGACPALGTCARSGSVDMYRDISYGKATLKLNIDTEPIPADPPPTDAPEPSSIVLLLLGGGFLAIIMKKRGVGGRSWRFSTGELFRRG